jgi:hypothetical protein
MISPYARLKPGESYTWHYDWYACRVGGDCPVLDCTSTGVTCERLTAIRVGDKLRLQGRFGVFSMGRAEAVLFDAGMGRCGIVDLGPVSPAAPLLLSADVAVPAAAVAAKLVVRPAVGQQSGELAGAVIAH